MTAPIVALGLPSYDGSRANLGTVISALQSGYETHITETASSLLTLNFNHCYADALNYRATHGATHFLLLHADISIEHPTNWVRALVEEMARVEATVLSAVVAMKDGSALVSTGLEQDAWTHRLFTQQDVADRPVTWTEPGLLVNSGCLLLDLTWPGATQVCFTMTDRLERDAAGSWRARIQPEDWTFSRQVRALGGRVYATSCLRTLHHGAYVFVCDLPQGVRPEPDRVAVAV